MSPGERTGAHTAARLPPWLPDAAIAGALFVGYLTLLLATTEGLGYARDEGFYFHAARAYEGWFELLFRNPRVALTRAEVDRYWAVNHEHPALVKSLFALSHRTLYTRLGLFTVEGTSFRFPGMVLSAAALPVIYGWGKLVLDRRAGLVAALLYGLLPRVFFHAHLACFDAPVTTVWLVTAFAYWRSVDTTGRRSLGWALATGVLYGLLLNTKHNAWLFPALPLGHYLLVEHERLGRDLRRGALPVPPALLAMATLGPLVLFLTWPWLWFDTVARLREWVEFHTRHDYYNMEFLGQTYWKPPMPRLYAWVMTLATVPGITLLLSILGLGHVVTAAVGARWPRLAGREGALATRSARSAATLWWLAVLVSYGPWWSSDTPIFGGTKHWMPANPMQCQLAGVGYAAVERASRVLLSPVPSPGEGSGVLVGAALPSSEGRGVSLRAQVRDGLVCAALILAVLSGPLVMTLGAHPWGLTFYTPLVGGAPGAATLGLNRTFWGYTTGAAVDYLNRTAPPEAELYVHDTALQSYEQLVRDGALRPDLRGTLWLHRADCGLYHHEAHMRRVEYQAWVVYGSLAPVWLGAYHGVPVVWVYAAPGACGR